MKRALALLCALVLTLSTAPVGARALLQMDPAQEDRITRLQRVVQEFIDAEGYTSFLYDSSQQRFKGLMQLDNGLKEAAVDIYLTENSLAVYVTPSAFRVETGRLDSMAVLSTLINWKELFGVLLINYGNGVIMAGRIQAVEGALPELYDIYTLVHGPVWLMEDYGDALIYVNEGGDPQEAYRLIRERLDSGT